MKTYIAAPGARFNDEAAQNIGQELETMHAEKVQITPDNVIARAVPEENPLHPHFEWEDAKAAHNYRKEQARHLVSHILIVEESKEPQESLPEKAFYSIEVKENRSEPRQPEYITVASVKENGEALLQVASRAISEMRSLVYRWEPFLGKETPLDEYREVFEFIKARMK